MIKRNLVFLTAAGIVLTACSTNVNKSTDDMQIAANSTTTGGLTEATSNAPVAGTGHAMDEIDRTKLSRALDGGIGKATSWQNANTGITYTVVPTGKLSIGGNPFCRKYTVTSEKGSNKNEVNGTACVSTDGAWHPA